jgi:hypothetical protein
MTVSFATDTVTVVRAARVTDSRNDIYLDWTNTSEHDVERCRWQPGGGSELHGRRDGIVTDANLFAPHDADIDPRDRIRFDGVVYDIDGPIKPWRSATGALAHLELALTIVEG